MPVRIHFRGLVLFRFPLRGPDAGKLVAELISEPESATPGPHHHRTEIQLVTGERALPPRPLKRGERIDITIAGKGQVERAASFRQHVPRLSRIAAESADPSLRKGPAPSGNRDYVRNTVTVNRGVIRVKHLATWDEEGFPIDGKPREQPPQPAEIKFLGSAVQGHMAGECVLEVLDADEIEVSSSDREIGGRHRASRAPNPHTSANGVEVLVSNLEFQRAKPVPWAMDFQWLFLAAGYSAGSLPADEYARFRQFASAYDAALFDEDRATLLPDEKQGLPFPYVVGAPSMSLKPLAELDNRPLCVPGDGE
ncbi:MAG TPA: hypothetical protein VF178_04615 [Gemmatimonadaceae bacterium]